MIFYKDVPVAVVKKTIDLFPGEKVTKSFALTKPQAVHDQ